MNQQLRDLFRTRRTAMGLTHEQLAEQSRCSAIEIHGFERGLFTIGVDQLYSLVQILKISPEELYLVIGEPSLRVINTDPKPLLGLKKI